MNPAYIFLINEYFYRIEVLIVFQSHLNLLTAETSRNRSCLKFL